MMEEYTFYDDGTIKLRRRSKYSLMSSHGTPLHSFQWSHHWEARTEPPFAHPLALGGIVAHQFETTSEHYLVSS